MIFLEALLGPNIFLITATNDFCLLLLGNRKGNSNEEKLSAYLNNNLQGPFLVMAVRDFSYLEVFTSLCSTDEQSLWLSVLHWEGKRKCFLSHSLTNWFFFYRVLLDLTALKWCLNVPDLFPFTVPQIEFELLNFVFFGVCLKGRRLFF